MKDETTKILLIIIGVLLAGIIILQALNFNKGRYRMEYNGTMYGWCYILDTKTSEVWLHTCEEVVRFGTNEKPVKVK